MTSKRTVSHSNGISINFDREDYFYLYSPPNSGNGGPQYYLKSEDWYSGISQHIRQSSEQNNNNNNNNNNNDSNNNNNSNSSPGVTPSSPLWLCVKQRDNSGARRRDIMNHLRKIYSSEMEMFSEKQNTTYNNNNNTDGDALLEEFCDEPLEMDVLHLGSRAHHRTDQRGFIPRNTNRNHLIVLLSAAMTEGAAAECASQRELLDTYSGGGNAYNHYAAQHHFDTVTGEPNEEEETENSNNNNNYNNDNNNGGYHNPLPPDEEDSHVDCFLYLTPQFLVLFYNYEFKGRQETEHLLRSSFSGITAAAAAAPRLHLPSVLGLLISTVVECGLPDLTLLLSQVDSIDEMVLLIAPGERDQPDLLRRIALLRRNISVMGGELYRKERLLGELMSPAVKLVLGGSRYDSPSPSHDHNNNNNNNGEPYPQFLLSQTLEKVVTLSERVEDARDTLNQSNINFVTGVSMRMSQSSAMLDFKMQVLGQVATICLPLNLVASIFGMNCKVPFQSDEWDTLVPFFVIIIIMVVWCVICSVPTIRSIWKGTDARPIVPTESS